MIQALIVQNYLGESETIYMANPSSGFAITSIEGISPGDATINVSDIASTDGAYFNSARKSTRQVAINFRILSTPDCEYNRHKLARVFPLKKWTRVYFMSNQRLSYIEGYVESNAVEVFTNPVTARVSILCPEPYFHSVDEHSITFSGEVAVFEFDFEIETTTEVSQLRAVADENVYYDGEVPNGITMKIHATGTIGADIYIYDTTNNGLMVVDYAKLSSIMGSGLTAGDDLVICTVKGKKSAMFVRNGVEYNVLNAITRNATWFELQPGDNVFTYATTVGQQYLQFAISYDVLYSGA